MKFLKPVVDEIKKISGVEWCIGIVTAALLVLLVIGELNS